MATAIARGLAAVVALTAVGCSAGPTAPGADDSELFIAQPSSFSGFCSWKSAPATTTDNDAGDGIHGLGPLTVYWNQSPPHGATSFPNGTIIVKADENADPTQRIIFAMVKRGGDFNATGAVGWDWYSLQQTTAACDMIDVLWSGTVAPQGESYAGTPVGNCNDCHTKTSNDAVWDSALQLSNF
jgi:hypothetical protein